MYPGIKNIIEVKVKWTIQFHAWLWKGLLSPPCSMDDLHQELGRGTLLVLLDLTLAFDTISHAILLGYISGVGLGATYTFWRN